MEVGYFAIILKFRRNTVLKLRAVAPSENQRFDSWSDNVSSADRKNPEITVTLAADATYTPNFVDKPK